MKTLTALCLALLLAWPTNVRADTPPEPTTVAAPTLQWQHGGCYSSWCETGWYASPAVTDLDGDGTPEIVASAYSIVALDGATGALRWRMKSGHDRSAPDAGNVGRTWPGVVVADVDADGTDELVTAHSGGAVSVYTLDGYFESDWPQEPTSHELRGLSVYDLDGDGTLEIVVTGAVYNEVNTWVYEHTGALRPGWPQLTGDGYAHGVFNDNAAVADLDGDDRAEIIVPSDVHYVAAYAEDGAHLPANAIYPHEIWGEVGIHVDHAVDLRGWAHCGTEHRPNFAHTPAAIADLNGDGVQEIVVMGNVYNCGTSPYTSLYEMPFVFNLDRTRWQADGFDWTVLPTPDGDAGPLSEDWHEIESNMTNPVLADLDGDGNREILYSSYDGRVHAYWLDKTEHGDWPYAVTKPGATTIRFASEPVVADLDADGSAEVLFTSWTEKGSGERGCLHVLSALGIPLHEILLPAPVGSWDWNGALPAPTLANVDADTNLEVVLQTAHAGVVVYELPNTADARILWGTGRGNQQRTGSVLQGNLHAATFHVAPNTPAPGDVVTYTVTLRNPGPALPHVSLTNTLPLSLTFVRPLTASAGSYGERGGVITWTGSVPASPPVTLTYGAQVTTTIARPYALPNTLQLDDGLGNVMERSAPVIVNGLRLYLPLILK